MAIHRYYYQGTKYDMTKGDAAGPFGNPDRYKSSGKNKVKRAREAMFDPRSGSALP